jgi:mono/diheme cytochrome c family protein
MPFANLSTADLTAVISYLRTQAPVRHAVAPHSVNALGKVVEAFIMKPKGPTQPISDASPSGPTVENGRYITHDVGNCIMCHTKVDLRTGAFAGPIFGGGASIESVSDPNTKFTSPNLTPHPRWGWIASWPEEVFVARMKLGKQREGSPMPWHGIKRQSDDDLRAIYRYLRTVPPAEGGPDPSVQDAVVVAAQGK